MENLKKIDNSQLSGLTKKNDLVIHSIPKRFINSKEKTDEHHKGMGILILGLGTIVMIAGVVLVYFFVFKENPLGVSTTSYEPAQINADRLNETPPKTQAGEDQEPSSLVKETEVDNSISQNDSEDNSEKSVEDEPINSLPVQIEEEEATSSEPIRRIEIEPDFPEEEIEKKIVAPAPGDQDRDGLYDFEEALLGTSLDNPDSDGDSYRDLDELRKMFNPAGEGKIIANDKIEKYTNSKYSYSFYYPVVWQLETTNTQETIILKIDNNQFFQVVVAASANGQSVDDWYRSQFETSRIGPDQLVYKEGWSGVKSEDGSVYYLKHPSSDVIYALTYSVAEGVSRVYENVINMIIDSLDISN